MSVNIMKLNFTNNGTLYAEHNGKTVIGNSPVGTAIVAGTAYSPISAEKLDGCIHLHYSIGDAVVEVSCVNGGSHVRLTLLESSPFDSFVFGPYMAVNAVEYGEMLGAGWADDGSCVCIQSLNPKTVGGCPCKININSSEFPLPCRDAAGESECGIISLQCTVTDMSEDEVGENNTYIEAVPGEDGILAGASVALTAADSASELLDEIGKIELLYGLPHPTIDGEWAKKSPKTSEIYFVINGGSPEKQIAMAERAGVHCLYFSDPFKSWGHFEINRNTYPNGFEDFKSFIDYARSHGVDTGFHTLSNFLHTHDPYVSPVPHPELLIRDKTVLVCDISESDTDIRIADSNNYRSESTLNTLRIGDELIRFGGFDEENSCLISCIRGAFGTKAVPHTSGSEVLRLWDHGYGTLFPSLKLQAEVADNIGNLVRKAGIRRISFDGVEGCTYTGRGEYACSEFVRRVFEKSGSELLCDASTSSHYRWHAHSYFNWGEPWYDEDGRGGMYNYRARHQEYFKRNLLPGMLGWYQIRNSGGKYEATTPEVMEYILSRNAAFDAGSCICIGDDKNGMLGAYLDMVRLWSEFRFASLLPEDVKKLMREEKTDWHLERNADGWLLSELDIKNYDLGYGEHKLKMESGTTGYGGGSIALEEKLLHRSNIIIDRFSPSSDIPDIAEPLHFRIRAGYPGTDCGTVSELRLSEGWFGSETYLIFKTNLSVGDYIEYNGGKNLYHYDCNLNLIDVYEGEGQLPYADPTKLFGITVGYVTGADDKLNMTFTLIRTKRQFRYPLSQRN